MSKWDRKIKLIALTDASPKTDSNGFIKRKTETVTEIFADKLSVTASEFYKADIAGYKAELKFNIYSHEYSGQEIVEVGGKRYKVIRTYETNNGEFTELTLADLPVVQDAIVTST